MGYYSLHYIISKAGGGLGKIMPNFYEKFHPLWRGSPFPRRTGKKPVGEPTPSRALNLQPGELVRVRSHKESLQTLNTESQNRRLLFDVEIVPVCGNTYRVLQRVSKIINEHIGMQGMKTPYHVRGTCFAKPDTANASYSVLEAFIRTDVKFDLERVSENKN